jgi:hypothetical protein
MPAYLTVYRSMDAAFAEGQLGRCRRRAGKAGPLILMGQRNSPSFSVPAWCSHRIAGRPCLLDSRARVAAGGDIAEAQERAPEEVEIVKAMMETTVAPLTCASRGWG